MEKSSVMGKAKKDLSLSSPLFILAIIISIKIMIGILVMIKTDPGKPSGTAGRQVHLGATIIKPPGGEREGPPNPPTLLPRCNPIEQYTMQCTLFYEV